MEEELEQLRAEMDWATSANLGSNDVLAYLVRVTHVVAAQQKEITRLRTDLDMMREANNLYDGK